MSFLSALPHAALRGVLALCALASAGPSAVAQSGVPSRAGPDTVPVLVYSVNRLPESPFETARPVVVFSSEDLRRMNARTLPEALMDAAGVFVQQTGYGGGSPIVRGFVGKQVLILVDGVRINNATFRSGAVQYLNTIDINMIERVEIVRGGEAVLSSDALGAIINVITRRAPRSSGEDRTGGLVSSRFSAADASLTTRGEGYVSSERVRVFAGATQRRASNVRAGGDMGTQASTGYTERAGDAAVSFLASPVRTINAQYQVLEQRDVPRTDRITDRTNLLFLYTPQRRQLGTLQFQQLDGQFYNSLKVTTFWNRQDEGRREVRAVAPGVERRLQDTNVQTGASLELSSFLGETHRLLYGADFSTERIASSRTDTTFSTGVVRNQRGLYTDGATYSTTAIYLQDHFTLTDRLTPTIGVRYANVRMQGSENSAIGALDIGSTYNALTASANLMFKATRGLHLIASVTSGFRAPNIEDISVFDRRPIGQEVPSPGVRPERSLSYEAGVKVERDRLQASGFLFQSHLTDLLVQRPGTFQDRTFIDANSNGVRDAGELTVIQKQNVGSALLRGVEADARFRLERGFTVFGNAAYTRGDDQAMEKPLEKVPPAFGLVGVDWAGSAATAPWARIQVRAAAAQHRLSPVDTLDSRIGPDGEPGFADLTIRSGLTVAQRVPVTLAIENVFDRQYKYFSSGVFRPGRQLVAGVRLLF